MTLAERGVAVPTVSLASLLGGGSPALSGESPLSLEDYAREILASGFPGLRNMSARALNARLDGYLDRIVEHDFQVLGRQVRNPAALRRWLSAYAAATSTTATFEAIRDAATGGQGDKPAKTTTAPYRDILERLFVLDPVPAWAPTANRLRRLAAPPKHHVVDPALAARLLGVDSKSLLAGETRGPAVRREGTLLGALFESLVTLDVRVYSQSAHAGVGHLRVINGDHEVDLIVERADGRVIGVEIKLAQTPHDSDFRHLNWLKARLGDALLDGIVVTTGRYAYRRPDGWGVVPAGLLGP